MDFNAIFSEENKIFWDYVMPFLKAILIVVVGKILITLIVKILKRSLEKTNTDASLANFLSKAVKILGYVIIIATIMGVFGISTTGIIAAVSAAAVGVGVALKDSLSNVAGGILLLFFPRFVTGDCIEVESDEGKVIAVDLMHTTILTFDNKQVSIPNGVLINNNIVNYSREETRRVDIVFPISYEADVNKAKDIAMETILKHPLTLKKPDEPFVRVKDYSDSSVNIVTRVWCKTENYWALHFDLTEQIREAFDNNKIDIPFNQLDVHIK